MGMAAALAPDDPVRLKVLAEVTAAGEWAEQEWLDILRFDEDTRVALQHTDTPANLHENLRHIPGDAPIKSQRFRLPRPYLSAAAAILVLVSVVTFMTTSTVSAQSIASLTVDNHLKNYPGLASSDPAQVERSFQTLVDWPVHIPDLGPGYELIEARACRIKGKSVICTRWLRDGQTYALYQFCPLEFSLSSDLPEEPITVSPDNANADYTVRIWKASRRCGYALLTETHT